MPDPKKLESAYLLAARIAIKYGPKNLHGYEEEYIEEFWDGTGPSPSLRQINIAKVSVVKWFINKKIKLDDPIWNADFLHGLMRHGSIGWHPRRYASFKTSNDFVMEILKESPFGGNFQGNLWLDVPALYLSYSESSISFLAGILCGSHLVKKDKIIYNQLPCSSTLNVLTNLGIPIEKKSELNDDYYISPVWGALLTPWMPEKFRDRWLHIVKPLNADIYCPILWQTHVDNYFTKNGIPYLKCRKTVYNKHGSVKNIELKRLQYHLTELAPCIGEAVRAWSKFEK